MTNFLATFFVNKTGFLSTFFSNPKFEAMVYSSFLKAKSRIFFFYAFSRISPRKINTLKNLKWNWQSSLGFITLTKNNCYSIWINILKSTTKNVKKRKKKKSAQNFFILNYVIKSFKTSNFYYLEVLVWLNFLWRYESSKFLIFFL